VRWKSKGSEIGASVSDITALLFRVAWLSDMILINFGLAGSYSLGRRQKLDANDEIMQ
jgi:hypothetical protein